MLKYQGLINKKYPKKVFYKNRIVSNNLMIPNTYFYFYLVLNITNLSCLSNEEANNVIG